MKLKEKCQYLLKTLFFNRLASSPLKTLDAHSKGILSVAWCQDDSDLLLSCGKDNRIICWNPNSNIENGEVLCELAHSSQWSFNVAWCPRNPAVIASSSFDSRVSIYSLMGGQQQVEPSTNIADSFPGMDKMTPVTPAAVQKTQSVQLKQPPKWLKRPCGANFGFGGKLVTFEAVKQPEQNGVRSCLKIASVITENSLVERSVKLETSLQTGNLSEFCEAKVMDDKNESDKEVWQYIKANFDNDPRTAFLNLLQYEPNEIQQKVIYFIYFLSKVRKIREIGKGCIFFKLQKKIAKTSRQEIFAEFSYEKHDFENN